VKENKEKFICDNCLCDCSSLSNISVGKYTWQMCIGCANGKEIILKSDLKKDLFS